MAAGQGFKTFATGDVLTAADTNGYLMSQTVMVFADSSARSTAITSPQQGMISFLKGTNSTEYYNGSAWVTIGGSSSGGMTLISTTALTSGSTQVLSSIPTSYKNLYLVIRDVKFLVAAGLKFRFNSDSTANRHALQQSFTVANQSFNTTGIDMLQSGLNATTELGMITCSIPDYANTVTWKQVEINAFVSASTSTNYNWDKTFGFYNQTSAITSIDLVTTSTFVDGTALLYGVS